MRRKIIFSGYTIGAAALIVSLAGNVQAIPITARDFTIGRPAQSSESRAFNAAGTSSTGIKVAKVVKGKLVVAVNSLGYGHLRSPLRGGLPIPVAVFGQGNGPIGVFTVGTPATLPWEILTKPLSPGTRPPSTPSPALANAPDGGMTVMLLAGSFCGLALLKRKWKA